MFRIKNIFLFLSVLFLMLLCISCSGKCFHRDLNEQIVAPTCGDHGYTLFSCNDCSYSFKSDIVEPIPHSFNKKITAPSCKTAGYTTYTCEKCEFSYVSDHTDKTEHSFTSITTDPSCTTGGYTTISCSVCSYKYTKDPTDPVKHTLEAEIIAPTCTSEGYTRYTCKNCVFSYKADFVSANTHSFTSEVITPTCLDEGYTRKICLVCKKEVLTNYIEPTGHEYTLTTLRATSSSDGYTVHDCINCDYSYNSNYVYSHSVFLGAYTDSESPLARGIDISNYNGYLNWRSIASQNIDFVILRAGSSVSGKDPSFDSNYASAKAAGLDVGVYYYVEATSVESILEYIDDLEAILEGKKFEYPVFLDIEKDSLGSLGKDLLTEMAIAFIEKLQSDGYFAGLYTNNNWLVNNYHKETVTELFDIWYARYIPTEELSLPTWNAEKYGANMGIWQYTQEGTLDGITGTFDLNLAYRNYPKIIKEYHYNGY